MRMAQAARLTLCMDDPGGDERLSLVDARLPAWCTRWVVTVEPGATQPFAAAEWREAIVVVEQGEVVLVGASGSRLLLGPGAVLVLDGVDLQALHNPGDERAVLVAVARRIPGCPDQVEGPGDRPDPPHPIDHP
jgi:hypothetical protein